MQPGYLGCPGVATASGARAPLMAVEKWKK